MPFAVILLANTCACARMHVCELVHTCVYYVCGTCACVCSYMLVYCVYVRACTCMRMGGWVSVCVRVRVCVCVYVCYGWEIVELAQYIAIVN